MMLTTPPIASEPYTADAPSDRISMRSTAASGMALRSVPLEADIGFVGARRPSIRTRVRPEPTPRRSIVARDWADEPDCGLKLPNDAKVESRRTSATEMSPEASICVRSMTTTGTAPSISARFRREPVTWMVSSSVASVSSVASCANAGRAAKVEAAPARSAKRIAPDSWLKLDIYSLSNVRVMVTLEFGNPKKPKGGNRTYSHPGRPEHNAIFTPRKQG